MDGTRGEDAAGSRRQSRGVNVSELSWAHGSRPVAAVAARAGRV